MKQLNFFNKYLLLVSFETNDNYSIRFEMEPKHYSHSNNISAGCVVITERVLLTVDDRLNVL